MIKIHYFGLTNPTTLPVPQTYFSLSSNNCMMYPGESDQLLFFFGFPLLV